MEYVNLGRTGLKVSRICMGTMSFGDPNWRDYVVGDEGAQPVIKRALELGINFFDTADVYSIGASEEVLGRALKKFAQRDQVVIATKVYSQMSDDPNDKGLSRKHIMDSVDASLRRLDTDYIDLYQIHRWDYETPIEETLAALHDVVQSGKVRYIGASSMHAWRFAQALFKADMHGWTRFVSMQNHYNLVYREEEREMMALCTQEGIGVIPWSPIARGFLTGNRTRSGEGQTVRGKSDGFAHGMYHSDSDYDIVDRVTEVAGKRGVSTAQIALAWVLHNPVVNSPIIGTSKVEQLEDSVGALEVKLSEEEVASLEELYEPHQIYGFS